MRTLGLLALFFLLPSFAYAALVNINTADATLLDTLPGIGAVKAQAIVDYRSQNGPFVTIEDIQNVSGIGPVTFTNIKSLITVGDTGATATSADTASSTQSTATRSSGAASTYTPPPAALLMDASVDSQAILEVPLHLSARVKTKGGAPDLSARIVWSFGDGSATEGSSVEKTYRYVGTYLVKVTATDGTTTAQDEFIVSVKPAVVRVAAVSGDGITIANDSTDRLDLSLWRLSAGTGSFRIPDGTALLPNTSVLFPSSVTNLPVALDSTSLAYPGGIVAARYMPPPASASMQAALAAQPSEGIASSSLMQTVEPIISATSNIQAHEEAAHAPAAATELAAAGAALAPAQADAPAKSRAAGIFHSPWTLGLLGIMALAGGVFILL